MVISSYGAMLLFRPPLTPPNLGGEVDTTTGTTTRVTISPPKLGGVRGGLNKFRNLSPHGYIFPSKGQEKFPNSEAFYVSNLETYVHKSETPVANLET